MSFDGSRPDNIADMHEEANPGHKAQVARMTKDSEGRVEVYCLHCDLSEWVPQ
jgi:hypothetical protein